MNLKDLETFKLNKVQMNNLIGGVSAICNFKSADGTITPVEINTNITDAKKLRNVVASQNLDYTILDCTYR